MTSNRENRGGAVGITGMAAFHQNQEFKADVFPVGV